MVYGKKKTEGEIEKGGAGFETEGREEYVSERKTAENASNGFLLVQLGEGAKVPKALRKGLEPNARLKIQGMNLLVQFVERKKKRRMRTREGEAMRVRQKGEKESMLIKGRE